VNPWQTLPVSEGRARELRRFLTGGGLLVIPTESSYALAADPRNEAGVAAIFRLKGRTATKALPVVVAATEQLPELGILAPAPLLVALESVWPAALTVVFPLREPLPAAGQSRDTLAVRVPEHSGLRQLLRQVGPLTATSANRSGEPPCLDAAGAAELVAGERAVVIDGGTLAGGPPSTLARWRDGGWEILRRGPVTPPTVSAKPEVFS
jgi:tRNA threonylcarbamoyl adenosine modification protein (Sua5/YciO/YrdC/YwlC family)